MKVTAYPLRHAQQVDGVVGLELERIDGGADNLGFGLCDVGQLDPLDVRPRRTPKFGVDGVGQAVGLEKLPVAGASGSNGQLSLDVLLDEPGAGVHLLVAAGAVAKVENGEFDRGLGRVHEAVNEHAHLYLRVLNHQVHLHRIVNVPVGADLVKVEHDSDEHQRLGALVVTDRAAEQRSYGVIARVERFNAECTLLHQEPDKRGDSGQAKRCDSRTDRTESILW